MESTILRKLSVYTMCSVFLDPCVNNSEFFGLVQKGIRYQRSSWHSGYEYNEWLKSLSYVYFELSRLMLNGVTLLLNDIKSSLNTHH